MVEGIITTKDAIVFALSMGIFADIFAVALLVYVGYVTNTVSRFISGEYELVFTREELESDYHER